MKLCTKCIISDTKFQCFYEKYDCIIGTNGALIEPSSPKGHWSLTKALNEKNYAIINLANNSGKNTKFKVGKNV